MTLLCYKLMTAQPKLYAAEGMNAVVNAVVVGLPAALQRLLAAFTIASIFNVVISPRQTTSRGWEDAAAACLHPLFPFSDQPDRKSSDLQKSSPIGSAGRTFINDRAAAIGRPDRPNLRIGITRVFRQQRFDQVKPSSCVIPARLSFFFRIKARLPLWRRRAWKSLVCDRFRIDGWPVSPCHSL